MSSQDFNTTIADCGVQETIGEWLDALTHDLRRNKQQVEVATCPVHGENLVLRKKNKPTELLYAYFLGCPRWLPNEQGCNYVEKLKSGPQLAALLRTQTREGIL